MGEKRSKTGKLEFDGALTIRGIEATHAALTEALRVHSIIEIDCSAATEVDLSFIQLLLSARKSAQDAGQTLELSRPADGALLAALRRGGFLPEGGQPTAEQTFWLSGANA